MADLLARFKLVDEMSDKLGSMAERGQSMTDQWEQAGDALSAALSGAEGAFSGAVGSVDGIAISISGVQGAADSAASSTDALVDSLDNYGDAAAGAAEEADYWTDAIGNYDKSAMEALYSTEELVEMGYKSAEALAKENEVLQRCEKAASELSSAIDEAGSAHDELAEAIEKASQAAEELAENENVSTEAKEELARASAAAGEAMEELAEAQQRAERAMSDYDEVLTSGTSDLGELERVAQEASDAAQELEAANSKAANATEDLANATERAADEAENSGEKGIEAVEGLSAALAAAGIAKMVNEVADAFMQASETAAEFETATAKISTIADTMQTSIGTISSDLMDLSMATGQSVNGLSEAAYSALSASVETASAVDFTATATKLAAGGFTSSATSVDVLTTALNAYGLEASYAENISDMLITTQNLGKTTVDELAASVGKVIPLASAYGVEMDNLSTAYVELTKGGIATAEAGTYLKSILNELGDSGSKVSAVLMEQTGSSFSALTEQGYSLGDVMAVLGNSVNGNAGAFNELWSSSEAGIGALSLYNAGAEQFNTTLGAMQASAGATAAAYETMTDTTAHAQEELSNAATNLQIAVGQSINPLMEKLYSGATKVLNAMTTFSQEHPVVTKGIVAIGVGLAAVAVGIGGVSAAMGVCHAVTKVLTPAMEAFGGSLTTALGPIGLVAAGITAVVGVALVLADAYDAAKEEALSMNATTAAQVDELNALEAEYENVCATSGELSEEALRLKYQIDDLSASIEQNGQSLSEWSAEMDGVISAHDNLMQEFDKTDASINSSEASTLALATKLSDLVSASDGTVASQTAIQAVLSQLNGTVDGLSLSYEGLMNNTAGSIEAIREAAEAQAQQQRQVAMMDEYVALVSQASDEEKALASAKGEVTAATERASKANQEYQDSIKYDTTGMAAIGALFNGQAASVDAANENLETALAYQDKMQSKLDETNARIAEIEAEWGYTGETLAELVQNMDDFGEAGELAAQIAFDGVREKVEALSAAYDAAYQSALDSFSGQFGLFDTAAANMDATVANAQAALDSQLAYWETYGANIETLKSKSADDLGITQENYEALMSYVQGGSEEAAGLAASMVEAINSGNTEVVAALATTMSEVTAKQQEIAAVTADWQTDFSAQMQGIVQEMQATVSDMNLTEEASAAATSTINGYAQSILAGKGPAVAAAQEVANAVTAALASAKATINVKVNSSGSTPGHAKGTTNAESLFLAGEEGPELVARPAAAYAVGTTDSSDFFIAGENGPELIMGEQGSTVFPTSETDRLIAALNTRQTEPLRVSESRSADSSREAATEQVKHILLEIAGSGTIEVGGGGVDKETVLEVLVANLKPVLMSLIQSEIYEEGELSYDY